MPAILCPEGEALDAEGKGMAFAEGGVFEAVQ